MTVKELNRREFLKLAALGLGGATLTACGIKKQDATATPTGTPNADATEIANLQQANDGLKKTVDAMKSTPVPTGTATVEATKTGTPEPTATKAQTNTVEVTKKATAKATEVLDSCPQARDLGPWAPSASGKGETFEVTASDTDSAGVILGLWWPKTNVSWGTQEITTFIPSGLSIEVEAGAGRGWDFEKSCSQTTISDQMKAHMEQRKKDTNYYDFVGVEKLVQLGLVKVRFDRRGTLAPTATK